MLGIVVLNYNAAKDTIDCIESITKYTSIDYRIYIVDACSNDNSLTILTGYFKNFPTINVIEADKNGGYSYGNNLGALKALNDNADAILIVNPDVLFEDNSVEILYNKLMADARLSVIGPRILNTSGENMQFASRLFTFKSFLASKKPLVYCSKILYNWRYYKFNPDEDFHFQGMVSGCCFMIKSDDLKLIDFLDTRVFLFYEEDILAYKLAGINKLTMISARSVAIHNHSNTIKKEGKAFNRLHRYYSSQFVLKKYANINKIQYVIVSLFHLIPFAINSLFYKSYRELLPCFVNKISTLYSKKAPDLLN